MRDKFNNFTHSQEERLVNAIKIIFEANLNKQNARVLSYLIRGDYIALNKLAWQTLRKSHKIRITKEESEFFSWDKSSFSWSTDLTKKKCLSVIRARKPNQRRRGIG
ncbi:hypothetical protein NVP2275O_159 [Vibrio phage 2.275.O._10N.286.54.E11]|nr:hypothetical protein NVP2275O_159 [Vibrio phage 2.275.O._10N.286.54.E11]